jgi:DNA-binding CsgD family transcriptional regulator
MYDEYWRPRSLAWGLRMTLMIDPDGDYHTINLIRAQSTGPFEAVDISLAQMLTPHLQQAIALQRRLRKADLVAAGALAALDALPTAMLLLDRQSRLVHANTVGAGLLAASDGLGASFNMLVAATPALTNRLAALLASAAGASGQPPRSGVLRLARPSGRASLLLLAMPFPRDTEWRLPQGPALLLSVTDPEAMPWPPGKHLAELFGLTGAEARLATDLISGLSLREIAEQRGRGLSTVRTLLARLMAKTAVGRQSELIRLLLSVPRLHESTGRRQN